LSFKPAFHSPLSPSSRDSLVPLRFLSHQGSPYKVSSYIKNDINTYNECNKKEPLKK